MLGHFRGKGKKGLCLLVSCFGVSLQALFGLSYSCLSFCPGLFGAVASVLSLLFMGSVL